MKSVSILAAVLLCLLAGCVSHRQVKLPKESSVGGKIEAGDDFKIEVAVYGYLLNKHPWDGGKYAAIFLQSSDDRVAALIKQFPHQVPPLKPAVRAQPRPNQAPLDQDTGKPGILLSAKAMDPTNGVSEAVGSWSGGETVSGVYAFVLVEMNGEWTIQSAQ
jgi:hypothetical protein